MKQPNVLAPILLVLASTQSCFADPIYSVTPVNFETIGVLLNNQGQYVVPAYNSAFLVNGYGPNAGQGTPINIPGATAINPIAMNDSGQVVGSFATSTSPIGSTVFLYANGQVTNLTTAAGFYAPSGISQGSPGLPAGLAINNAGVVAGSIYSNGLYGGNSLGTYSQGVVTNLGLPPASTGAFAPLPHTVTVVGINNSGQIAVVDNQGNPPALYANGHFEVLQNQSFVGGVNAIGLNNNGQLAGQALENGLQFAALYTNGIWKSLGSVGGYPSFATAINDSGAMVGSFLTASLSTHAFLYQNGTMTDLNSLVPPSLSGVTLLGASSINNLGQIVAYGEPSAGGPLQDYLLTPPGEAPLAMVTNLPEPGPLTLFGLIMGGLGVRRAIKLARRTASRGAD